MKLIADLLSRQDPNQTHTALTRTLISLIIVGTHLVYAWFFGVLASIGVYLAGVELMNIDLQWMFVPVGLALIAGLWRSLASLKDYWRNYGHG